MGIPQGCIPGNQLQPVSTAPLDHTDVVRCRCKAEREVSVASCSYHLQRSPALCTVHVFIEGTSASTYKIVKDIEGEAEDEDVTVEVDRNEDIEKNKFNK